MTKLHGMAKTMQIGEHAGSIQDTGDARVQSAVIHGMTESFDVEEAGTFTRVPERRETRPVLRRSVQRLGLDARRLYENNMSWVAGGAFLIGIGLVVAERLLTGVRRSA